MPESTRKLRISHISIQPHLVWDDGEHLAPGPAVGVSEIGTDKLATLLDELRGQLAELQAQQGGGDDGDS
jgi:hypothetical protein